MNNIDQLFRVGELLLRLHQLPTSEAKVALLETECLAGPERSEVAVIAYLWLVGGKKSPLRKRLKVTVRR
jgi:hypothetical protein